MHCSMIVISSDGVCVPSRQQTVALCLPAFLILRAPLVAVVSVQDEMLHDEDDVEPEREEAQAPALRVHVRGQ